MRALALFLTCGMLLPSIPGFAQATAQPPADDGAVKERAKALFGQGREAFKARDFKKALELFRESEATYPAAGTRLNIALTLKELGKLAEAMEVLDALVAELPADDRRRKIAVSTRDAMAKHVPLLAIRPAATISENAEVSFDGVPLPPSELGAERRVNPGRHTVLVRAPDHHDKRYDISLEPGEKRTLTIEVGLPVDKRAPPPLESGEMPGPQSDPVLIGLGITALVLGAGGIAGGAITGAMALSNKGELDDTCPDPALCTEAGVALADEGQTLTTASTILFIGGGVFATVGVVLTIVGATAGPQTEVAVTPNGVTATLLF